MKCSGRLLVVHLQFEFTDGHNKKGDTDAPFFIMDEKSYPALLRISNAAISEECVNCAACTMHECAVRNPYNTGSTSYS